MRLKHLSYVCGPSKPLVSTTVGDLLRSAAKNHPRSEACFFRHQGVRLTYLELLHRAESVANGLLCLGLQRHSRIGIFAPNCQEWVVMQFAAALSDLVLVTMNPAYGRNELLYSLNSVGCEALVMTPGFKDSDYIRMMGDVCPEIEGSEVGKLQAKIVPSLKWVIKTSEDRRKGFMNFGELYGQKAQNYEEVTHRVDFEAPTNILFTSGTTGNPKGTVLTHHNLVNNAQFVAQGLRLRESDRICMQVPLYHCFGSVLGTLASATAGSALIFPDSLFAPATSLAAIEEEKCTTLYGVPTMFQAMMNEKQRTQRNTATVVKGVVGAALPTPELVQRITDELGIPHLINAYGMTELSPAVSFTKYDQDFEKKSTTSGQLLPCTEAKIVNDANDTVPLGEAGELCIRGYLVMKEYWDNPSATQAAIDSQGWFRTGDIAIFDKDLYLKIVGRKKDMILRGGENIFPSELEKFYDTHPDIEQIHVFGVPDDFYGEVVCAWVKMKQGRPPVNAEDLKAFSSGKIAHYKVPKVVRVVDGFPLTPSGKIMKYILRAEESKMRK